MLGVTGDFVNNFNITTSNADGPLTHNKFVIEEQLNLANNFTSNAYYVAMLM
jgi:hypothetical protein